MEKYSVKRLAQLAGVSVRTLHHYDQIGLLHPAERAESRYRYYGRPELLRLQQILFFRELDVPLHAIKRILDDPAFDQVDALRYHRHELVKRRDRLQQLLRTLDKTIAQLTQHDMMTDDELYAGFSKEQATAYDQEAKERWGEKEVETSKNRLKAMNKQDYAALQQEAEAIGQELAAHLDQAPDAPEVQALVHRHYRWLEHHYPVTAERYRGLANLYVDDERFRAFYDQHQPGLAVFLKRAMDHFSDTVLDKKS
ncbi:MerR family transcriptional regulator [Catalinimonas alkaloidigena]|nr:MerR family transcriptional regulator [Catalinimonas alkaloidigena]